MTRSPLPPTSPTPSDPIAEAIAKLRSLTQISVQPQWRCHWGDLSISQVAATWQAWATATLNAKNHVSWAKGRQVLWLAQHIVVPHDLGGYPLQGLTLRLALVWWAEATQVYVNGKLVQEGDLFDATTRLLLSESVRHNDAFEVAIRLESPGHDSGALVKSLCLYEFDSHEFNSHEFADASNPPEPGFIADELAVLQEFVTMFAPDQLEAIAQAVGHIPWSVLTVCDRLSFDRALANLRQQLQPLGNWIKQRKIQILGHSHLDMAWLWTVSETWQVAERTFRSVLNLQEDFPELTYCHTTPALYEWIEKNRPDLFAAITAQIAAGRWEVSVAPLWIEPEMNLISGEAIARHLLYGQRYLQKAFGQRGTIAWLPDTFGFNWQLPQLLKQGGVEYFVTQKLRWNDTTQFPHEAHWWQAPDGTKIFSLQSAPIGEGIDPVKMAQYACTWETKTTIQTSLWLMGVGDHGGGPTRDMLQLADRWGRSPFFPQLEFTTAQKFLDLTSAANPVMAPAIAASIAQESAFPTWNSELYLELHQGCYTNHADQKQYNRRCEDILYEAELFASLKTLITGADYPKAELEAAWKKVLFNQFHDILPGTSIAPVFVDANRTWQEALDTGWNIRQEALKAIAAQIKLPLSPHPQARLITVFNSLNWKRSEVVTLSVQQSQDARTCFWQVCDLAGHEVVSQPHCWREGDITYCQIFFHAEEIPAIGYRCYWLVPRSTGNPVPAILASEFVLESFVLENFVLENDLLRVTIDPATGNLSGLQDKVHQRDLLSRAGNELQAFRDSGQYWDAWNIDPKYAEFPLPAAELTQISYEDRGAITTRIRVIRKLGKSIFNQVYILDKGSAVLKIHTQVDWQESHVVVKAAFPLNLDAAYATYEIPCGAIQRSTLPQENIEITSAEKAKWEVSALRWADLSDTASQNSYGVSILSDCKQGYDSQPHQIRLTLLRGSEWPAPDSDRGQHQFTYAIYPHDRSWQSAHTVQQGYALNQPLQFVVSEPQESGGLPSMGAFLDLQANNFQANNFQANSLVLTALKPSEQEPDRWILRFYEAHGESAQVQFKSSGLLFDRYLDAASVQLTNLLEEPVADDQSGTIAPWKIKTFSVKQLG